MRFHARTSQWISRVLVAALLAAATPLPTLAGEPPAPAPPRPTLTAAIAHAATVTPLATASPRATATQSGKADMGSPSFFKKPVGIVVLLTLAAGVGYAVYSTQNDRITSPAKK